MIAGAVVFTAMAGSPLACIIHEDRGAPFLGPPASLPAGMPAASARGPPPGRVVPPYQTPRNNRYRWRIRLIASDYYISEQRGLASRTVAACRSDFHGTLWPLF